jgi:biotin carboxylase
VLAAEIAAARGIPFHPVGAAQACHDKFRARQLFQAAGLPVPAYFRVPLDGDPREAAGRAPYPCVLKPLDLSASRGVIRANGEAEFVAAFHRIGRMAHGWLQVESYIPGREFAVEGLVTKGRVQPLAIFDKPDPLEGPFFEETIYVTPSRETASAQAALVETTERAVRALGLWHGPWHAELRYNREGAWLLEVAARPIGGLCARALRFEGGVPLEELILRHAIGEDVSGARLQGPASGVMMIPIPRAGIYQSVAGVEDARAVTGIEDVVMTAERGHRLVPLPEGASYLGFLFARGQEPATVETALREAHGKLRFTVNAALETL